MSGDLAEPGAFLTNNDEFPTWNFGGMVPINHDAYDTACNWKLAMDTFGETYHFSSLHKDMLFNTFHGNVQCYDDDAGAGGHSHRMILCRRDIDQMALEIQMFIRTIAQDFAEIIRDEDYVMGESQQAAANSGALDHFIFGRNEPALHHYHATYAEKLGLPVEPLLDTV